MANNPDRGALDGDKERLGETVNDLLDSLLPWAFSILLHAGLILASVFLAWTVTSAATSNDNPSPIVPAVGWNTTPGAPLSMSDAVNPLAENSSLERPSAASLTASNSKLLTRCARGNGTDDGRLGSGSPGAGAGTSGAAVGWGDAGFGNGNGEGIGKANPFGSGVGDGGSRFRTTFIGSRGNARNLVYLVDASGSLIDTLPLVLRELQRSIGQLSDQQKFTVIFFQGNDAIEAPPAGLKRATGEVKQSVMTWVDPRSGNVTPMNRSNPLKALRIALSYKPDLVFILSDNITGSGINEIDQRQLLDEIRTADRTAGTKINTIQFLYPDKLTRAGLTGTLELIANQTGGVYKFLDGKALGVQ